MYGSQLQRKIPFEIQESITLSAINLRSLAEKVGKNKLFSGHFLNSRHSSDPEILCHRDEHHPNGGKGIGVPNCQYQQAP